MPTEAEKDAPRLWSEGGMPRAAAQESDALKKGNSIRPRAMGSRTLSDDCRVVPKILGTVPKAGNHFFR